MRRYLCLQVQGICVRPPCIVFKTKSSTKFFILQRRCAQSFKWLSQASGQALVINNDTDGSAELKRHGIVKNCQTSHGKSNVWDGREETKGDKAGLKLESWKYVLKEWKVQSTEMKILVNSYLIFSTLSVSIAQNSGFFSLNLSQYFAESELKPRLT